MKLTDFDSVTALVRQLQARQIELETVRTAKDGRLGITIHGTYQDESMTNAVRPSVIHELCSRIHALKQELQGFGVSC